MKTHVRRMTFPLHLRVQLCETVKHILRILHLGELDNR
uniref:Uncharacterized protein n=1 Tax=Anguilla anguilla TaxID=7936 RepID=A0A0E9VEP9_ANGAN